MCEWGTKKPLEINGRSRGIDSCIWDLVKALNDAGIETVCCCCGHGESRGLISLVDGQELVIYKDIETAEKLDGIRLLENK